MFKVKKFFGWFSFKKFVAVGLSCMMFLQCSSLSFASERKNVDLIENSTERIATQHKDGKYYVARFDKRTKILVQNIYIDGTNKLIDTVKCDLNRKNNLKSDSSKALKGCYCKTMCGSFSYNDDNDILCSRRNESKIVLAGISSQAQFDRAREFEKEVSSLKGCEERIGAAAALILAALLFPAGILADLTEAMLEAAGIGEGLWEICFQIREKCRNCDIAYEGI